MQQTADNKDDESDDSSLEDEADFDNTDTAKFLSTRTAHGKKIAAPRIDLDAVSLRLTQCVAVKAAEGDSENWTKRLDHDRRKRVQQLMENLRIIIDSRFQGDRALLIVHLREKHKPSTAVTYAAIMSSLDSTLREKISDGGMPFAT
jgi:hypothetical protein